MTKFKVGDKFVPRKPKGGGYPHLDDYWESTLIVKTVENGWITCNEHPLIYHVDWCEKVEEHIPDISKTIDWEQRRYEIAKEYLAAQINGVYAGNLEWSCYGVAKSAIEAADELIKQLQESTEI